MKRTVVVDLDGTLTVDDPAKAYPDKALNPDVAAAVHAAVAQDWGVAVLTARGMRTYRNDVAQVEQHVKPVAQAWLDRHGVPHDALHVGKPWCGPGGFYVDDRNLHLEEFVFRFTGPFAGKTVRLAEPGRGERLTRWLALSPEVEVDYVAFVGTGGAGPEVWFATYGAGLEGPGPVGHAGGGGLAPFALVPPGPETLEQALAVVREQGFCTGGRGA